MEDLKRLQERELSLSELVEAAGRLLLRLVPPPSDGRVAELPDARTVRYYQTIGLIDKPLRYEGRSAVYAYKHLLQILAVKRLQAHGLTLAQIQRTLAGATASQLESALSQELEGPDEPGAPRAGPARRLREAPALSPLPGLFPAPASGLYAPDVGAAEGQPEATPPWRTLLAREVAPGVTVLLDRAQVPDPEELIKRLTRALGVRDGEGT